MRTKIFFLSLIIPLILGVAILESLTIAEAEERILTTELPQTRLVIDTGQLQLETHNNVYVEVFIPITNGVIIQPSPTNETRSYVFESVSNNQDDFTVTLQKVDNDAIRWAFDTVKSFILPEQARGNGNALQGLSSVDDIRLIINGSELSNVIIHGNQGSSGKGTGQGIDPTTKGRFGTDQITIPKFTNATGNWNVIGAIELEKAVSDLDPDSDNDFSYINATDTTGTVIFDFEPMTDPQTGLQHSVKITGRSLGSGQPETVTVLVLEDGVERCDFPSFNINRLGTYTTDTRVCTQTEGNTIIDYTKLQVSITPSLDSGEEIRITKIEMIIPKDPAVEPFGEFSYNGTHNIIDVSLSKQLNIFFTNSTGGKTVDLPLNATGLDQKKNTLNDRFPTSYTIIQIDTFVSVLEYYNPDSVRLDLIRDDLVISKRSIGEVLQKMENFEYGIDYGLSDASRILGDHYTSVSTIDQFLDEIKSVVVQDTRTEVVIFE